MELLKRVDQTRITISEGLEPARRKQFGQFMTPTSVSEFMASMFDLQRERISLLDAGAGVGSLIAAYIAKSCQEKRHTHISVDAYEIDPVLAAVLRNTLADCASECEKAGIGFVWRVIEEDFIKTTVELSAADGIEGLPRYDVTILNPPYAKLNSGTESRKLLRSLGIETSNLYSAFVAIAIKMLNEGGQLVAITPRSFCNGPYFRPFRYLLLDSVRLRQIHVYESRSRAFKEDEVLQENVIFHVERNGRARERVKITSCNDPTDKIIIERFAPIDDVVVPHDPEAFIHITTTTSAGEIARKARSLPCSLDDLNLTVSTGRVVDFRAREYLKSDPGENTVPLIYPTHFDNGFVAWPKDTKKANAIVEDEGSMNLLVTAGCYTLTKRFSSKEEKRRVVSAVYDPEKFEGEHLYAGFENHLNYYHEDGGPIDRALSIGLCVFLNSSLVDDYFRQFSGHTQVNATDLRSLRYPDRDQLKDLGQFVDGALPEQSSIDRMVEQLVI